MDSGGVPTVRELRKRGKFFGYILPGHYEIWRIGKALYTVIDGACKRDGQYKHWEYVELHKPRQEQIYYAGFHPHDGTPCLKE